jgi:hypothetical protein|eukprot:COSAG02_NODE_18_length_54986_cov_345.599322_50_plen_61_part_00
MWSKLLELCVSQKDLELLKGGWALVLGVENADGSCSRAVHSQLQMAEVLSSVAMAAKFAG